jgi:hypothetical protein
MRRRQRASIVAADKAIEQRRRVLAVLRGALARAGLQDGVRPVPQLPRHDRLVLAAIDVPPVHDLADVGPQVQDLVDVAFVQRPAGFRRDALRPQAADRLDAQAGLDEQREYAAHPRRLWLVHHQLAVGDVVAERNLAAHPHAARGLRPGKPSIFG